MERYKDFLLIEVPEIAENISISNYDHGLVIDFDIANQYHSIELPPGNYTIVGKGDELTPADWISIVDKENDGSGHLRAWWYKDYMNENRMTRHPELSGHSLLKSKNLSPSTTLIIQIKLKIMENSEIKSQLESIYNKMQEGLGRKTADKFNPSENRFNEISNLSVVAFQASDSLKKLIDEL